MTGSEPSVILPMREGDLPAVLAVERLCHAHPWSEQQFREELAKPFSVVDLLWVEGALAGYLCSWFLEDELEILNVATAPAFRRRGVARRLLGHVLDRAAGQGMSRAFLEVRSGNRGAIELYHSFGFRVINRRARYYGDGEDALVMEKTAQTGRVPSACL